MCRLSARKRGAAMSVAHSNASADSGDADEFASGVEEAAADWLARHNGGLSVAERKEFEAWLAAAPSHAAAFAVMEETWSRLNESRQQGHADAVWADIELRRREKAAWRRRTWSALGAAAAVVVLLAVLQRKSSVTDSVAPAAVASRAAIRTLTDGSKVALNAGAEIEVSFSPETRRVRLIRGEALFTVTKDVARPFVVTAGTVGVRAVGTEFSVRHAADAINVLVTEGRVAVDPESHGDADMTPEGSLIYAVAGHHVVVPSGAAGGAPRVVEISTGELATALAWRGRRVEFSDMPLAEAVDLFNRRGTLRLSLAEPALGQRAITGILW
ncbi:MAG: DUF4880 domain-containing protein, partial [Opitutus sp.]|nr:DUF4880 domain-containing protein [Opitutus sp.]